KSASLRSHPQRLRRPKPRRRPSKMGQKVNPISMRLQVNKDWRSKWFANKREYARYLKEDLGVRRLIENKLGSRAAINKVDIERSPNLVTVTVVTAKAGVVIGRGG